MFFLLDASKIVGHYALRAVGESLDELAKVYTSLYTLSDYEGVGNLPLVRPLCPGLHGDTALDFDFGIIVMDILNRAFVLAKPGELVLVSKNSDFVPTPCGLLPGTEFELCLLPQSADTLLGQPNEQGLYPVNFDFYVKGAMPGETRTPSPWAYAF